MEMNDLQQNEMIAQFESITGIEDTSESIQMLRNHNWNLQSAVDFYFETSRNPQEPHHSSQTSAYPVVSNVPFTGEETLHTRFTQNLGRLLSEELIPNIFPQDFPNSILPLFQQVSTSSLPVLRHPFSQEGILEEFEQLFGNVHPFVFLGSFSQALDYSKLQFRFLIAFCYGNQFSLSVNIPSSSAQQFANILRNLMSSSQVCSFINENFVFCLLDAENLDNLNLPLEMVIPPIEFPYMGILYRNEIGEILLVDKPKSDAVESPETFIFYLTNLLEKKGNLLDQDRQSKIILDYNRKLREEQEQEFNASLAADQQQSILKKEQESKENEDRLFSMMETELHNSILQEKNKKLEQFSSSEPEQDDPNAATLIFRMPDGRKIQRRFYIHEPLQTIFDFLNALVDDNISNYDIISNFPKKVYTDPKQTVQEANLFPKALLFLQKRDEPTHIPKANGLE